MNRAIIKREFRDFFLTKKIIYVVLIIIFVMITIYASGFLQVAYLLFFKPENIIPFPITITYYILFMTLPLFTVLLGNDLINKELEDRTIRGIITKVKRSEYILSKYFFLVLINSIVSFILLISSGIFSYFRLGELNLINPIIFFLYLIPYILALSSIVIFASSLITKSSSSMLLIIMFFLFALNLHLGELSKLSLFNYSGNIINLVGVGSAILAFLLYSFFFTMLSILTFEKRDL